MLEFGGRKVEGEWWHPLSPQVFTPRETVRAYLPKHSLVPSETQLAVRKGEETRKGEQYLLPAGKVHLCSRMNG